MVRGCLAAGAAEVIVVDNGSTDGTAAEARAAGARVVAEPERGYGRAMRAGIAAVRDDADVIVSLDGDGSDPPEALPRLVAPIAEGRADFVLGSRRRGQAEPGALGLPQRVAGLLAALLIRLRYGVRFSDMAPVRAIRAEVQRALPMRELTYGWTLEQQMLCAARVRCAEVPVDHRRRRGGVSKVSGDVRATLRAASRLAVTFLRIAARAR